MTSVAASYVYNFQQLPGQITVGNVRQNATYNASGMLTNLQTGTPNTSDGIATTVKADEYTYDPDDASLTQHAISVLGNTAYTYSYEYDSRGNITQITRANAGSNKSINYTYDAANQLVREDNQIAGYSWAMTYDNAGNMLSRKKYSYTTGTLGSVLSTQTFTYGKDGWGDVLTKINSTTVTSDASGNTLSDGTNTYTWKNGRQLATVTRNGATWTNTYDASGMRTERTSGSTTYRYTYDGTTLAQMTVGSNALIFTYGTNGHPMSVNFNGVDYYYMTNALGDVIGILGGNGNEVVTYIYDAWGNCILATILRNLNLATSTRSVTAAMSMTRRLSCITSGTTFGVTYEWIVHNFAYAGASILGLHTYKEQARSVDIGKTVFADRHDPLIEHSLKIPYIVFLFPFAVVDLFINGGYR